MRRVLGGLRFAAALGLALASGAAASAGDLYVYKGNGSDGRSKLPAFEAYVGRKADGVVDFIAFDSWTSFDNDAGWGVTGWKGSGYKLAESVPLTVQGTSLAQVAAGAEDAHFVKLAQTLIAAGFPDAALRLGWEFNGSWYPWAFHGHEADYRAAFRHVVGLMRAQPGARFRFVWNTALFVNQGAPDQGYPGDDVVDVVATDAYNQSWVSGYTDPARRWASVLGDPWGVKAVADYAAKHAKPLAFPEWATGIRPDGHGGGDDPLFIQNMAAFVRQSAFSGYWDFPAPDFNGLVSGGQYPAAGAALKTVLSAPAKPAPASVSVTDGGSASVLPNADGSAVVALSFPSTATTHHYILRLSRSQKVGVANLDGTLKTSWGVMSVMTWDTKGGVGHFYMGNP